MQLNDINFDAKHIWHPYTSMTQPIPAYPIVSASGVELELADGRKLIDGMASWWAAIHGYNHPVLNQAASQQLTKCPMLCLVASRIRQRLPCADN